MFYTLKKLWRDCLTGIDGKTYDPARVGLLIGLATFLFLAVWALVAQKQPWGPQEFGIGFGAVLAGGGAAVGLKAKTEPSCSGKED